MKTFNLYKYGQNHPMTFKLNRYVKDNNLYVGLVTHEEGYAEAWSDLTVNLDGKREENHAFIDTNNNGDEILTWLVSNQFCSIKEEIGTSGFCVYPLVEFNMDKLMEYVSENGLEN